MWRHTATATQTPAERQCREETPDFSSLPTSSQRIWGKPPRTQRGAENRSGGAEEDHPAVLSSQWGRVIRTGCGIMAAYLLQALDVTFYSTLSSVFLPFVHPKRKRCHTSQIWLCEAPTPACCAFLGTTLEINISVEHLVAKTHWGFTKTGYCSWWCLQFFIFLCRQRRNYSCGVIRAVQKSP